MESRAGRKDFTITIAKQPSASRMLPIWGCDLYPKCNDPKRTSGTVEAGLLRSLALLEDDQEEPASRNPETDTHN